MIDRAQLRATAEKARCKNCGHRIHQREVAGVVAWMHDDNNSVVCPRYVAQPMAAVLSLTEPASAAPAQHAQPLTDPLLVTEENVEVAAREMNAFYGTPNTPWQHYRWVAAHALRAVRDRMAQQAQPVRIGGIDINPEPEPAASAAPEPWKCCEGLIECAAPGCAKSRAPEPTRDQIESAILETDGSVQQIVEAVLTVRGAAPEKSVGGEGTPVSSSLTASQINPAPCSDSALETELQDFLDHMSAYADAAIPEHQLRGVLARCRDALRSARPVVAESADPYPKWTWGQKDREHALSIGIREIEARAKERGNPSCIEASVLKKMLDEVRARPVVAAVSPTREQIADALHRADAYDATEPNVWIRYADVVMALYAQATEKP